MTQVSHIFMFVTWFALLLVVKGIPLLSNLSEYSGHLESGANDNQQRGIIGDVIGQLVDGEDLKELWKNTSWEIVINPDVEGLEGPWKIIFEKTLALSKRLEIQIGGGDEDRTTAESPLITTASVSEVDEDTTTEGSSPITTSHQSGQATDSVGTSQSSPRTEATPAPNLACKINIKDKKSPLVVDKELQFKYSKDKVSLKEGEEIYVICPIQKSKIDRDLHKCQADGKFLTQGGKIVKAEDLKCDTPELNKDNRTLLLEKEDVTEQSKTCSDEYKELKFGYYIDVNKTMFLSLYTVCFDETEHRPFYSKHLLTKWNDNVDKDRPLLDYGNVYGQQLLGSKNEWKLYDGSFQGKRMKELLGTANFVTTEEYFSAGLLIPNTDFFYAFQTYATFAYANVAPQWKKFRKGNWHNTEEALRTHVTSKDIDYVSVYTGTLGNCSMQDIADLYLKEDDNLVHLPQWFWKIIYSDTVPEINYVIFIYNFPSTATCLNKVIFENLCENDVVEKVSWMSSYKVLKGIDWKNEKKGLIYACDFDSVVNEKVLGVIQNLNN